jgi:hypothetical protein
MLSAQLSNGAGAELGDQIVGRSLDQDIEETRHRLGLGQRKDARCRLIR